MGHDIYLDVRSLIPAPPHRPTRVLWVWDEDGWCMAWTEPVVFLAVVRRQDYLKSVSELTRAESREYENGPAIDFIDVVFYEEGEFTTLSESNEWVSFGGAAIVVPDDISWEELMKRAGERMRANARQTPNPPTQKERP